MVLVNTTKNGLREIEELTDRFNNYVDNNNKFKRKLEAEVSRIRETSTETADRLDIILREWGEI